jgi:hypothetical protein
MSKCGAVSYRSVGNGLGGDTRGHRRGLPDDTCSLPHSQPTRDLIHYGSPTLCLRTRWGDGLAPRFGSLLSAMLDVSVLADDPTEMPLRTGDCDIRSPSWESREVW